MCMTDSDRLAVLLRRILAALADGELTEQTAAALFGVAGEGRVPSQEQPQKGELPPVILQRVILSFAVYYQADQADVFLPSPATTSRYRRAAEALAWGLGLEGMVYVTPLSICFGQSTGENESFDANRSVG